MKKLRILAIIALAAVITFALTSCPAGLEDTGPKDTDPSNTDPDNQNNPTVNWTVLPLENPQAAHASGDPARVRASLNRLVFGSSSRSITKTPLSVDVYDASGTHNANFAPWGNVIQDSDDVYDPIAVNPGKGEGRQIVLTAINETNNAGRVAGGEDGISFYFKEVDAATNFKLSADFYIDVFGFTGGRTELNGQEAFGIMARDYVPQYEDIGGALSGSHYNLTMEHLKNVPWDGVYWNGQDTALYDGIGGYSNMIMVGGVKSGTRVYWRTGVYDLRGEGEPITNPITIPNTNFSKFDYQPKELSDYYPYGMGIAGVRSRPDFPTAGLTYRLHLEKTDAGFTARIEPPRGMGKGVTKTGVPADGEILEYNSHELPSPTDMLIGPMAVNKDKYYVGFFAARDAKVTITNITYEESPSAFPSGIDDTVYQVSIAEGIQNGFIAAFPTSATAGTLVTLDVTPTDGYWLKPGTLSVRQTNGVAVTTLSNGDFIMPFSNVIVSGEFEAIGSLVVVPGSGDKIMVADLNTQFNATQSNNGMRVFVLSNLGANPWEVTTPYTLGLWPDDNKFHIMGMPSGNFMMAGFDDALFLYYDKPFGPTDTFRFSARIRILSVGGISTGKGVHVGAYSPNYAPYADEYGSSPGTGKAPLIDATGTSQIFSTGTATGSKGVGLFLRAEASPQFRLYYSSYPENTTAAGNMAISGVYDNNTTTPPSRPSITLNGLEVGKEYIYEITRGILPVNTTSPPYISPQVIEYKMAYGFRLLDSKTYLPVAYHSDARIGSLSTIANQHTAFGPGPGSGYLTTVAVDSEYHPFGGIGIHPALREQNVFAGVCIPGSNVEVSQIKVWHNGDAQWDYRAIPNADGTFTGSGDTPDFATPDTTPQD